MTGKVKQLSSGVVIECSNCAECMIQNPDTAKHINLIGTSYGTNKKNCLLSVPDHGNRCAAYPLESEKWLIDDDITKIVQLSNDTILTGEVSDKSFKEISSDFVKKLIQIIENKELSREERIAVFVETKDLLIKTMDAYIELGSTI